MLEDLNINISAALAEVSKFRLMNYDVGIYTVRISYPNEDEQEVALFFGDLRYYIGHRACRDAEVSRCRDADI